MKEIPLWNKGKIVAQALVDAEDFEWLNQWKWMCNTWGYAIRTKKIKGKTTTYFMHKEILIYHGDTYKYNQNTHHINHNKIDNRKGNLQIVTRSQNQQSRHKTTSKRSSKYKGVSFNKGTGKWKVQIDCDKQTPMVRYFENEVDAAYAYNIWATRYHGEFAILNDLPTDYFLNPTVLLIRGRGVTYRKRNKTWEATITSNGEYFYLGRYNSQVEAELVYNQHAIKHFGDRAILNDIPDEFKCISPIRNLKNTTSKYEGIHYDSVKERWIAFISYDGKKKYLGQFLTEEDAHNHQLIALQYDNPLEFKTDNILKKTSQYKNVAWCNRSKKWIAKFYYNNKVVYAGMFDDDKEAYKAVQKKKLEVG